MKILENYKILTRFVYKELKTLGIDIDNIAIDHIGYQCSSAEDYEDKAQELKKFGELVCESILEDRRVGIYRLDKPLSCRKKKFFVVEIIEPKKGQEVDSGWEHAEFLAKMSLEELMKNHPKLDWDNSAINREIFPMISLKLNNGTRVKFPRLEVLKELERQSQDISREKF